eukprot:5734816-Pyramimonas_sp.AAC.1
MESMTSPHQKSMNVQGSQGWVSCGRFLVVGPRLYGNGIYAYPLPEAWPMLARSGVHASWPS